MIDLHNHILAGVDDGAADLDESLAIARQFVSEGVEAVVATPHLDPLHERGIQAPEVRRRVVDLQGALQEVGIDLKIMPGNELFLTPDAPALLAADVAASLNGTRFVLVEVSLTASDRPLYLDDTLFRLQLAQIQPILAHPERYSFVQRDPTTVDALVNRGVALQLTAPSLQGEYGNTVRKTAERLLQRGAYSLAGSDRHHPGRNRSLQALHELLLQRHGPQLADLLLRHNPARVIAGQTLLLPEPPAPAPPGFMDRFLGRR